MNISMRMNFTVNLSESREINVNMIASGRECELGVSLIESVSMTLSAESKRIYDYECEYDYE